MPALRRTDLFATPIWTADLHELQPHAAAMIAAAEAVLASDPASTPDLFQQSRAVLQESTEPGWQEFFRILAGAMEDIVSRTMPLQFAIKRAYLRSWVLRITDAAEFDQTGHFLNVLHSHLPAVLSSVFYLQVPDDLVDATSGGTTLRDPNSAVTRMFGRPEFHVAAAPLRLVIFPSYLEHCPERPPRAALERSPRLVVATDLRVEPD